VNRKELLDRLAAMASATDDPMQELERMQGELRERVFRFALEAADWSSHRAAQRLNRTTSTLQYALERHHPELERERLKRLGK
jgi:transcriptional regulator with GAF, ATPase, and Fis domain